MRGNRFVLGTIVVLLISTGGCESTGRILGEVAFRTVCDSVTQGLLSTDDSYEDSYEDSLLAEDQRRESERVWKAFWREHPKENQTMYEAFKDDGPSSDDWTP